MQARWKAPTAASRSLFAAAASVEKGGENRLAHAEKGQEGAVEEEDGAGEDITKMVVKQIVEYLWPRDWKTRALLLSSLSFLLVGKLLNVQVPFLLQVIPSLWHERFASFL